MCAALQSWGRCPRKQPQSSVLMRPTWSLPGQVCPGTWLNASDSFSCCSNLPVAGKTTNPRLVVAPLDLRITSNDTFVAIGTG